MKFSKTDSVGNNYLFFIESKMPSSENVQTTISGLDDQFAGRIGDDTYDSTKTIHIHRRNRAYVWNHEMRMKCLDSILKGYYIPPIICSTRTVNGREIREVMEGGNRITTFRRILENKVRELTDAERRLIDRFPITLVVMRDLNSKDQRDMFRRLNKNVRVTDGQLYAMSEDDSPLVQEAVALLNDDVYPLRQRITETFFDTREVKDDGKKNLAAAVAIVSGCIHGPYHIVKSFDKQEEVVSRQENIDRIKVIDTLTRVLDIFRQADDIEELTDGRKRRGQWALGTRIGPMLYDILTNPDTAAIQLKWVQYLVKVRRGVPDSEDAVYVKMASHQLCPNLFKKISTKVKIYVEQNRLATDEELQNVVHDNVIDDESADDPDDE
jgi:hypothetical protein